MALLVQNLPRCEPWCWHVDLQDWAMFEGNVGKYAIHGASGLWQPVSSDSESTCTLRIPGLNYDAENTRKQPHKLGVSSGHVLPGRIPGSMDAHITAACHFGKAHGWSTV